MKLFIKSIFTIVTLLSMTHLFADEMANSKLSEVISGPHREISSLRDQY